MTVVAWKPLPADGISLRPRAMVVWRPRDGAYVRPPEQVYEAGGIDVRLSQVPRELLTAMAGGAILRERSFRWTEWSLQRPGSAPARIGERGINALRKVAFIVGMASCRPVGSRAGSNSTGALPPPASIG